MPNTHPPTADLDALALKQAAARRQAHVDYGIYGLLDEHNLDKLEALVRYSGINQRAATSVSDSARLTLGRLLRRLTAVELVGIVPNTMSGRPLVAFAAATLAPN